MATERINIDRLLCEYIGDAWEGTRLGRDHESLDRQAVSAEILAHLESKGAAMRCWDAEGRMAWRATPWLQTYLHDRQAAMPKRMKGGRGCSGA